MYDPGSSQNQDRWRSDRRGRLIAFLVGAAVSGLVTGLVVHGTTSSSHLITATGEGASTTVPLVAPARTGPPTTTRTAVPVSAATTTPVTSPTTQPAATSPPGSLPASAVIFGTVTDSAGRPVADAYVIGLDSLTLARTDTAGRYSMPCQAGRRWPERQPG